MSTPEVHIDREEDYRFLHSMLVEKKLHLLFKIHQCLKRFEKRSPAPVDGHAAAQASSLADELTDRRWKDEVQELLSLLFKAHLQSLLSVHDAVALRDFEPTLSAVPDDILEEDEDSVKIVSLVKTKDPLGATIKKDESTGAIVVSRIMRGGAADKSGLIHEGDELKEVNGVSLEQRGPKEIPSLLAESEGEVRLTIVPVYPKQEPTSNSKKLFMRALFDYDPREDPAVPCKDAAVAFRQGDVLQLVSVQDDTWWQARHLGDADARAELVPSQELQERRVALQRPEALFKPPPVRPAVTEDVDYGVLTGIHVAGLRRSFRLGRESSWSEEAAQSRRWSKGVHGSIRPPTYLEVIPYHKDPTDPYRLVVLVGPDGVGVNELKKRLLTSNPDHYGVTIPYTTRERRRREKEGEEYHFVSVHMFEEDILNHRFIDSGRYNGHYYGTSLDSVRRVMAEGKVCLLDLNPRNLQQVFTFEFKPFVVFVKPPPIEELRLTRRRATFIWTEEDRNSEEDFEEMIDAAKKMESQYGRWFDKVIVNGDVAVAFTELKADLEKVEKAAVQWIPAEWISSSSTPERRSCSHLGGWI